MKRRRLFYGSGEEEHGSAAEIQERRWLLPYADMITLLMLFFIIMYALSTIEVRSYSAFMQSIGKAFAVEVKDFSFQNLTNTDKAAGEALLDQLKQSRGDEAERKLVQIIDEIAIQSGTYDQVTTSYRSEGVVISILGSMLFHSGKSELRPEAKQTLASIAKVLGRVPYDIRVEGHTDDLPPTGSVYRNNLELSIARGYAVAQHLAGEGVQSGRLSAAGYGDSRPVHANDTAEARAKNRRVDIVVLTREERREIVPSAAPGRP